MKVSAIQMDVAFNEPGKNRNRISKLIEESVESSKPDTIVLPEMWNVSFFPDNMSATADEEGNETQKFLSELASKFQINIVGGSVAVKRDGTYYNTSYSLDRNGNLMHAYDKVHLFSPADEHAVFEPGNKLGVFELDGVKVGVATCYDLRFVEWIRMMALKEVEVLFVPAAWPHPRSEVWQTLLKARAIENQFFVVGVNSVGKTDRLSFCGHSTIYDPLGQVLAESEENEVVLTAELDLSQLRTVRDDIGVFRDRRPELYK